MTNLREAREQGKLAKFIREREAEKGDAAKLDRTVSSMAPRPVPAEKPE